MREVRTFADGRAGLKPKVRSGETVVVLPLEQIQEMRTNELYLLERSMHYKGKPIEIRTIINIQKELKRRTGMI